MGKVDVRSTKKLSSRSGGKSYNTDVVREMNLRHGCSTTVLENLQHYEPCDPVSELTIFPRSTTDEASIVMFLMDKVQFKDDRFIFPPSFFTFIFFTPATRYINIK